MNNIGTSNHDKSAAHRRLAAQFIALDNPLGVSLLLRETHALIGRAYNGDYAAIDITLDLATAIERAKLTARETEALRWVYGEDLTQSEAGMLMGVSQKRIARLLDLAHVKIARVYEKWAWSNEGYSGISTVYLEEEIDESDAV
ncbi:sigma factor-like helix-turn-helix DNA-binding protein [Fictibacillus sp. Mic-4]|uniref:sigma factor-like helix-turn-helix DNA-binding protein n=1 Tax=Fictibacillus sp. Mic-4 TaxID=3132826 RepID=UPI003CF8FE2D